MPRLDDGGSQREFTRTALRRRRVRRVRRYAPARRSGHRACCRRGTAGVPGGGRPGGSCGPGGSARAVGGMEPDRAVAVAAPDRRRDRAALRGVRRGRVRRHRQAARVGLDGRHPPGRGQLSLLRGAPDRARRTILAHRHPGRPRRAELHRPQAARRRRGDLAVEPAAAPAQAGRSRPPSRPATRWWPSRPNSPPERPVCWPRCWPRRRFRRASSTSCTARARTRPTSGSPSTRGGRRRLHGRVAHRIDDHAGGCGAVGTGLLRTGRQERRTRFRRRGS